MRRFPAVPIAVACSLLLAVPAFAQTGPPTGGPPNGGQQIPQCQAGQSPTPQTPCIPAPGTKPDWPDCAEGQLPTPQSPCLLPDCAQGQVPTPQAPCAPTGPVIVCSGGGQGGGPTGGQDSRETGQPCNTGGLNGQGGGQGGGGQGGGGGGGQGGGQGGGTPQLSGSFLNHVWRMKADFDSYDAGANVLNCTITKFVGLPKKFAAQDDDLVDTDAFVKFTASTRVYDADGKRVPKETKFDALLDAADNGVVVGKILPPKKWMKDDNDTPTPTFTAKRVYISG